jgi:hypothetical protein
MFGVTRETLCSLRTEYPAGTKIKLVSMCDPQAPPVGCIGTVRGVDDTGTILVSWETGSSLGVLFGIDTVEKI